MQLTDSCVGFGMYSLHPEGEDVALKLVGAKRNAQSEMRGIQAIRNANCHMWVVVGWGGRAAISAEFFECFKSSSLLLSEILRLELFNSE